MPPRPLPALLAGAALVLAGAAAGGAPLPVRLSTADSRWRLAEVHEEAGPNLTFEAVAVHAGAPDRLIFLSSPATGGTPAALAAYARKLTDAFSAYDCLDFTEADATRAGFAGRDLHFDLVNDKLRLSCEMFVFANGDTWWSVLYAKPQDSPQSAASAFDQLYKYVAPPAGSVALKPVRVKNRPISPFAVSLEISRNLAADGVAEIVITEVPPGSDAARAGIRAGDEIVEIDGRDVRGFAAGVGKDDDLGRVLLNRPEGTKLRLKILPPGQGKAFRVTLRAQAMRALDSSYGLFGKR